jgi:two-component system, NtrC family, response regulator GlrR
LLAALGAGYRHPVATDRNDETHGLPESVRYAPRAVRSSARLSWRDAAGEHTVTLKERISVGSADRAGIVVVDRTVSRLHAELEPRSEGVWVRDLGSKNGTSINGILVEAGLVPVHGKVQLGSTEIAIEPEPMPGLVELWPSDRFGPLLGSTAAMRELFAQLSNVAPTESTVLVHGETGTGKELVARAVHDASPRAKGPFIVIDCGALSESLLESELFGHTKGAFTGANAARAGAIEAADGGTVFLDEIGELPLAMQPRLLRVLESRTVRRIGETGHRRVDVRFLSATHRDLRTMVNAGAFREDLYFRLAVIPLRIPPLRERRDEIPRLLAHFLDARIGVLPPEVVRDLMARPWLGNVRELRNFAERARFLGIKEALTLTDGSHATAAEPDDQPRAAAAADAPRDHVVAEPSDAPMIQVDRPYKEAREACLDRFEREYLRELLARHDRSVATVAEVAGLNRTYLYRLIKKHEL